MSSKGIYKSFTYTKDSHASHFNETCTQQKLLCLHMVYLHGMYPFGMNSHLSPLTSIYRTYSDFLFTKQFQIPLFSDVMLYYFPLLSSFVLNYFSLLTDFSCFRVISESITSVRSRSSLQFEERGKLLAGYLRKKNTAQLGGTSGGRWSELPFQEGAAGGTEVGVEREFCLIVDNEISFLPPFPSLFFSLPSFLS